jgi:ABC-2 type transport system permease protein
MKQWIAFWSILAKDTRTYYLKPPNISWGLIFPLAWTGMLFIRSGAGLDDLMSLLPGVVAVSIIFGTTSVLAVTVTFEKKGRSFDRLLVAPLSLELLMLAKTSGAILFGIANAFVPVVLAAFFTDLSAVAWSLVVPAVVLLAVSSTFLGLYIAVSVQEVFEAQTLSNFFRFPMIFLCGLFFPVTQLPWLIRPLAYMLPPTYGVDALQAAFRGTSHLPLVLDFSLLGVSCLLLFIWSLHSLRRKWIS